MHFHETPDVGFFMQVLHDSDVDSLTIDFFSCDVPQLSEWRDYLKFVRSAIDDSDEPDKGFSIKRLDKAIGAIRYMLAEFFSERNVRKNSSTYCRKTPVYGVLEVAKFQYHKFIIQF